MRAAFFDGKFLLEQILPGLYRGHAHSTEPKGSPSSYFFLDSPFLFGYTKGADEAYRRRMDRV